MRRTSLLRAAALALALPLLGALIQPARAAAPPPTFPKDAVALVNGESVPESAVERALERVPPARRDEVWPRLIDHLVNNLLIEQHLKASGYKVEKKDVDKRIDEMKDELKKVNRDFDKMLKDLKVSEDELRQHIEADLRWYKYATEKATDKELKKLFDKDKESFDGSTVKARHILLSVPRDRTNEGAVEKRLLGIRAAIEKEVKDGLAKLAKDTSDADREKERRRLLDEAFAKHAKDESDCPSKNQGGSVGPFPRSGVMVAPFAEAAFALKPCEMSGAVRTPFGYHLILVTEHKKGRDVKLDDVKDAVKEVYFDRLRESLSANLRKEAVLRVKPAK